jgi:hypothetical protein
LKEKNKDVFFCECIAIYFLCIILLLTGWQVSSSDRESRTSDLTRADSGQGTGKEEKKYYY